MIYAPTVRQWSESVFAGYMPDGLFGEFVGTAETREEAQALVVQALDTATDARNMSPSGGNVTTAGRKDPEGQFGGPR